MSHEPEPPDIIYIIRHAEKPYEPSHENHPHRGVDLRGKRNEHSLIPRGWQRSGALAALFDPVQGPLRPGLRVPEMLIAPSYGGKSENAEHRTHQTISGVSERHGIKIAADFAKGDEPKLAQALVKSGPGVVLVCWEHSHIPDLASALPLAEGTVIPKQWPPDRFDVIWTFTRATDHAYSFTQIPQLLLSGDTHTVIEAG